MLIAFLLIELSANVPGKAMDDGCSTWALATRVGKLEGVLVSVWSNPGHCGFLVEYTSKYMILSVCVILSFKQHK